MLGAVNGALIVVTRVPDIVVTLAMLFVWQGAALLVLRSPRRSRAADWLRALIVGTVAMPGVPTAITDWIPRALVVLVVCLGIVWVPLSRSRLGLSIYAIGSSSLSAFRSGVAVGATRIIAYALAGLFAAMGGLVLTHEHRHRRTDSRALSPGERRRGGARRRHARRGQGQACSARSSRSSFSASCGAT